MDDYQNIKRRFWIKEQKRGKRQKVVINASIQETLEEYFAAYPEVIGNQNNFIFFNTQTNGFMKPIKRGHAWKIITAICHQISLSGSFGTHSLRKNWGYHACMSVVDLAPIMHKLNHESITYTKRYPEYH